jgi:hypothetical protein
MRHALALALMLVLSGVAVAADARGPNRGVTQEMHPWGRFKPGAWKLVRVVTETIDEKGVTAIASAIETKTTLKAVEADAVVLNVESVVEMGGKRIAAVPTIVRQGLHGEPIGEKITVTSLGESRLTVGGQSVPCSVEQVESVTPHRRYVTKTYYSRSVVPYILRRETVDTNPEDNATLNETNMQVVALDVPCKVLKQLKRAARVQVVTRHAKGSTSTVATTLPEVPGGVVGHAANEYDEKGRLLRRSTMELLAYGLEPEKQDSGSRTPIRKRRARHAASS